MPGTGSPKTALVHGVPPVTVRYAYRPAAPYATWRVPVNAHVVDSAAHGLHVVADGGGAIRKHAFCTPGAGSPKTAFVQAVPPVTVRWRNCPCAPNATVDVPANEHVPVSAAHCCQPFPAAGGPSVKQAGGSDLSREGCGAAPLTGVQTSSSSGPRRK
ncbi:hypothetical protein [Dactylosporangium sp. NPDC050588]|uniref:hypothetical protein n=1 Tax=Dactylosporangium sp. NPDC050588 TaxID=3157211 RepID=UPI003405A564